MASVILRHQSEEIPQRQRQRESVGVSRHRFEVYLDKVFDFPQLVDALPEGRQSPRHAWQKVFHAVLLGAAMQIPSLLQIEAECRSGALASALTAL